MVSTLPCPEAEPVKGAGQNIAVSVIVPYHNEAETITTTLELIAGQTYPPKEVILVDSASTDNSHKIVDAWIRDEHARQQGVVFKNVDAGTNVPSSSKNAGVRLSSCDHVAFMDCGLIFGVDWLEKQVRFMSAGNFPVVSGGVCLTGTNAWDRAAAAQTYGFRRFRPCVPSTVAKKEVFNHTGPFHEGLRAGYDVEWPEKLKEHGIRRGINREVVVRYNGVNYADNLNALFFKSIRYAEGTLGLSGYHVPYAYLFLVSLGALLMLRHPRVTPWLVIAYLIGRGVVVPTIKSRNLRLFREIPVAFLSLPVVGAVMDAGKIVGIFRGLAGRIRNYFTTDPGSRVVSPSGSRGDRGTTTGRPRRREARADTTTAGETPSGPNPRICRIVTVPLTFATLLHDQIQFLARRGLSMTLLSSSEPLLFQVAQDLGVEHQTVGLVRKIDPFRDLGALFKMAAIFRRGAYAIAHSSTPKAGLIAALAGRLARVPIRLHTYTGQVWVEKMGLSRWVLKTCDTLIARLDTHCYADSRSQLEFLVREKVVPRSKISVLGDGSISGVDLGRFNPESVLPGTRTEIRNALGIPESGSVIIFVGRVTRDKGVCELVTAFAMLQDRYPDLHLILVGPFEPERDPLPAEILRQIEAHPYIHSIGFRKDVERYLAASDIFCLPSYREGFGSVIIEAGAMGLPSVATRVVGLVDAVIAGETGLLVPTKDIRALEEALERLIVDTNLRHRMGEAARTRSVDFFDADRVNELVRKEYFRWLPTGLKNDREMA